MKTAKLFKQMQALVDKHVEQYQSDFGTDKETIKKNPSEVLYYWYLRDCGTQLMKASDMQWIESGAPHSAEFWLSRAKMIYEVHVDTQKLQSLTPEKMRKIYKAAKPMPDLVKIEYLINAMSNNLSEENKLYASSFLAQYAKVYQFEHWKIKQLTEKSTGILTILAALAELRAAAVYDQERGGII